jgi:hypothetical protein
VLTLTSNELRPEQHKKEILHTIFETIDEQSTFNFSLATAGAARMELPEHEEEPLLPGASEQEEESSGSGVAGTSGVRVYRVLWLSLSLSLLALTAVTQNGTSSSTSGATEGGFWGICGARHGRSLC